MSGLYDAAYARRYREHDDAYERSEPSQRLAAWIRDVTRRFDRAIDVLDLGCGTGRYFWALTNVNTLTAVDASDAMLAEARTPYRGAEITARALTLQQADLRTVAFPPASFDLVYSIGVLAEHAPLTRELLRRVHSWLRPGGRFALTTVHPDSPSIPLTLKRRVARFVAPWLPGLAGRAVQQRLLSGGMYADETAVREWSAGLLTIESMDRFTSEAHLHVRAVLRKDA